MGFLIEAGGPGAEPIGLGPGPAGEVDSGGNKDQLGNRINRRSKEDRGRIP